MIARALLGFVFASITMLACAPPMPGEEVGDSFDALSGGPSISSSSVTYDSSRGTLFEVVRFAEPDQGALVCHAYQGGSAAEKAACDNYPVGYSEMRCLNRIESDDSPRPGLPVTECQASAARRIGAAPYDKGDGTYRVVFVNKGNSSDRKTTTVDLSSDFFQLKVDGRDLPEFRGTFIASGLVKVAPGSTTALLDSLAVTVEVRRDLTGQVAACSGTFSTDGLSAAEIAAKDAALVQTCAKPTMRIEGVGGWVKKDRTPTADRAELRYDATTLLNPKQHLVVAFAVSGRVRSYVFATN
jgi:hypothetical protein